VTTVLLLIFISGQLTGLFSKAASGSLPVDTIMALLGLKSISNLVVVLPLAFYLAILLAFSRLYRDNEIAVLSACGISQLSLLIPVLKLATIFAVFVGILSLYLSPWAQDKSRTLIQKGEVSSDVKAFGTGRFREIPNSGGVIYIGETDKESGALKNIFIQVADKNKPGGKKKNGNRETIMSAAMGNQITDNETGSRFLVLMNGYRYEGTPGVSDYVVIKFKSHGIRLDEQDLVDSKRRQKEIPTSQLWGLWVKNRDNSKLVKQRYSQVNRSMAELQWRASSIFLCLILPVLAVPLSKTSARQGRYTKLALAILIYVIYTNLLNLSRVWVEQAKVYQGIGLWWVHLLVLLIAVLLLISPQHYLKFNFRKKVN